MTRARLLVLKSEDDGESWQDVAESPDVEGEIYSVNGFRTITQDGLIIGTFTLFPPNFRRPDGSLARPSVQFFRIRVEGQGQ